MIVIVRSILWNLELRIGKTLVSTIRQAVAYPCKLASSDHSFNGRVGYFSQKQANSWKEPM